MENGNNSYSKKDCLGIAWAVSDGCGLCSAVSRDGLGLRCVAVLRGAVTLVEGCRT